MLVKALRLRYLCQKLPKDALRQEIPLIGELRYEDQPHGRSSMVCLLTPGVDAVLSHRAEVRVRHPDFRTIRRAHLIVRTSLESGSNRHRRHTRFSCRQATTGAPLARRLSNIRCPPAGWVCALQTPWTA